MLHAKSLSKPVVMERLNFTVKRASLRETAGARLSRKLSLFSYRKMHQMMKSRCSLEGVGLIDVNPAFSSLLGSYLYYGMKHLYTPHEMAAFVLARRGAGFKDMHKPVCNDRGHKALFGTVGIQPEKAPPSFDSFRREFGPRHLWSYLRRYWKAFSMIMQNLKKESFSVYRRSLEKWRSNVEGLHRSLDGSKLSLGLEDVASQPFG